MGNYFNELPFRRQVAQLGKCRFMERSEFSGGVDRLRDQKIVVIGCGAQGLNQALCLRDSGLDVAIALREEAIAEQRQSWKNATENELPVGTLAERIPAADLVLNLSPDKQHAAVIAQIEPLMKQDACLSYSHGFNIVEQGQRIRADLTVIMVAPKGPGTEVRQEYLRGFGVPTLIAVHEENDPRGDGMEIACAYACGIGAERAGVLESSFVAELKSDLMGEQTILCGMLQSGSLLCFARMKELGIAPEHAAALVQYGWETLGEALKRGGVTLMMQRLSSPARIRAFQLAEQLKEILAPLYRQHIDAIINGVFSAEMMRYWAADDARLLQWREQTAAEEFERTATERLPEQQHFDQGILMVAMVKAGVELAFEIMLQTGIKPESAYYESLHETPLIANLIARRKLHEMNKVISDTAEYGCYLFAEACVPLLQDFMAAVDADILGQGLDPAAFAELDNLELIAVDERIHNHPVEEIGRELRRHMSAMRNTP